MRALEIIGDREALRQRLGASRSQIDSWIADLSELPDEFYFKAVDVCLDHDTPSLWEEPPAGERPLEARR